MKYTVLGHYTDNDQKWTECVEADHACDAEDKALAAMKTANGWDDQPAYEYLDMIVFDYVIEGTFTVLDFDEPDGDVLKPSPTEATDNVTYHPILGGFRAERAGGFIVKDGEATIATFETEDEADRCAAEIAGMPDHEEIAVVPIDTRTEFIYLNPSNETDDGKPNVFLYQGPTGDPAQDRPCHHYLMFEAD